MPRQKKKEERTKTKEEELDLLFRNLLKSKAEEEDRGEKSELEEEAETPDMNIDLENLEFHQFVNPSNQESKPVLERMALSAPRPVFIDENARDTKTREERNEVRYEEGAVAENTPSYGNLEDQRYETNAEPPVLQPSQFLERGQRIEFQDPLAERRMPRWDSEPEKFEAEAFHEERRLPFQTQEKKYKEFKPKKGR